MGKFAEMDMEIREAEENKARFQTNPRYQNERFKAEERKEAGMTASRASSGEAWQEYARAFLFRYCETHSEVFCDDIWNAGLKKPVSPRAFGSVMKYAIQKGWIEPKKWQGRFLCLPSVRSNNQMKAVYASKLMMPF